MATSKLPLFVLPIWTTAPTTSDNAAEPLTVPSLAVTVRG